MKKRRIIVTAGTSITGARALASPDKLAHSIRERLENLRKEHPEPDQDLRILSAETNSLLRMGIRREDEIFLLCTDTPIGDACGRELQKVIENRFGVTASVNTIRGLQVDAARTFRTVGIQNLFAFLDKNLGDARFDRDQEVVLNVTGGFKSVVPYVTLYGILRRFPVVYLFERSAELIVLPPIPLYYDQSLVSRAQKALAALRREGVMTREALHGLIRDFNPGEEELFEAFFESDDSGETTLSAFGQLLLDDAELDALPVELSADAEAVLEAATGARKEFLETLLQHLSQPGWIDSHIHRFSGTDLTVIKPGRTPARAAGYRKGKTFRVCLLFPDHNQYERELPSRNRAQFDDAVFSPWTPSAKTSDGPTEMEDILKNQERTIANLEEEKEKLEQLCLEQEGTLEDLRSHKSQVERNLFASEAKNEETIRELRKETASREAALQSISQTENSILKVLRSRSLVERIRYVINPQAFLDEHLPNLSKE